MSSPCLSRSCTSSLLYEVNAIGGCRLPRKLKHTLRAFLACLQYFQFSSIPRSGFLLQMYRKLVHVKCIERQQHEICKHVAHVGVIFFYKVSYSYPSENCTSVVSVVFWFDFINLLVTDLVGIESNDYCIIYGNR